MTETKRNLTGRRNYTNLLVTTVGVVGILVFLFLDERLWFLLGVYGLLLGTSTAAVAVCLTQFTGIAVAGDSGDEARNSDSGSSRSGLPGWLWEHFTGKALENESDREEDTGWLIGRMENILVLTLVIVGEYTALSIIFAAKSWVRREDTASGNTTYYLAGTLVNFTYSIGVGIGTRVVLQSL